MPRKKIVKLTRKLELEQNAIAIAVQRELVLQAVRRWTMLARPMGIADPKLVSILAEDGKLQTMERARNRIKTVRRPNRKKKGE